MPHHGLEKPFWKLLIVKGYWFINLWNLGWSKNFHSMIAALFFATVQNVKWPGNCMNGRFPVSQREFKILEGVRLMNSWIPVLLETTYLLLFLKVEVYWYLWTHQAWCESKRKLWKGKSPYGSVPLKSASDEWQMWNEKTVSPKNTVKGKEYNK